MSFTTTNCTGAQASSTFSDVFTILYICHSDPEVVEFATIQYLGLETLP